MGFRFLTIFHQIIAYRNDGISISEDFSSNNQVLNGWDFDLSGFYIQSSSIEEMVFGSLPIFHPTISYRRDGISISEDSPSSNRAMEGWNFDSAGFCI
jgi:hypothetical protein